MCVERLGKLQSQVWQPDGRLYLVCGVTGSAAQALNCQVKWVTHRGSHWRIYISVWQAGGQCPLDNRLTQLPSPINCHYQTLLIRCKSETISRQLFPFWRRRIYQIYQAWNLTSAPDSVLKFWSSSVSFFNPRTFCPADTLVDPMTVKLVRMLMKPSLFGCWC